MLHLVRALAIRAFTGLTYSEREISDLQVSIDRKKRTNFLLHVLEEKEKIRLSRFQEIAKLIEALKFVISWCEFWLSRFLSTLSGCEQQNAGLDWQNNQHCRISNNQSLFALRLRTLLTLSRYIISGLCVFYTHKRTEHPCTSHLFERSGLSVL